MEEIYERCCGLDVHRDSITACIMIGYGTQKRKTIKTFPTFTRDIKELANWLKSFNIQHVAVESTGIGLRDFVSLCCILLNSLVQIHVMNSSYEIKSQTKPFPSRSISIILGLFF